MAQERLADILSHPPPLLLFTSTDQIRVLLAPCRLCAAPTAPSAIRPSGAYFCQHPHLVAARSRNTRPGGTANGAERVDTQARAYGDRIADDSVAPLSGMW